jgi:hypothetical protein
LCRQSLKLCFSSFPILSPPLCIPNSILPTFVIRFRYSFPPRVLRSCYISFFFFISFSLFLLIPSFFFCLSFFFVAPLPCFPFRHCISSSVYFPSLLFLFTALLPVLGYLIFSFKSIYPNNSNRVLNSREPLSKLYEEMAKVNR